MQRLKSLILLGMFILPICTSADTYYLEITPKVDNGAYQMRINDTVTFQVKGYQKNEKTEKDSQIEIDKVWWNFDKEILTKMNSRQNSITLKAAKLGVSDLTAIGMVRNYNCAKTITILVKDKER